MVLGMTILMTMNLHLLTIHPQHIRLWNSSFPYILYFVDDIAIQKGKLFGVLVLFWLQTSTFGSNVDIYKRISLILCDYCL